MLFDIKPETHMLFFLGGGGGHKQKLHIHFLSHMHVFCGTGEYSPLAKENTDKL